MLQRLFGEGESAGKTAWLVGLSGIHFWRWEELYNIDPDLPSKKNWSERHQDLAEGALRMQRMLGYASSADQAYEESLFHIPGHQVR